MKPRRDITLGEMQDECKRHGDCGKCNVKTLCVHYLDKPYTSIDLTDPPRFTEAQMALLKAWHDVGARSAQLTHDSAGMDAIFFYSFSKPLRIEYCMGFVKNSTVLGGLVFNGETLDLAELLGKDGAEC